MSVRPDGTTERPSVRILSLPAGFDILRWEFPSMIERRLRSFLILGVIIAAGGCGRRSAPDDRRATAVAVATSPAAGAGGASPVAVRRPPRVNPDALPAAPVDLPAARRAWQVVDGQLRLVDADAAQAAGLTLVDLSDGWAPLILADGKAADGAPLANRYRAVFVGLSNDKTDGAGQPLGPGERNYLELLGIPPSMSVLRQRFLEDGARVCTNVDRAKLLAVDEIAAFGEVEKRIVCEGRMSPAHHKAGHYDTALRAAVLDFQMKHAVMAQGDLNRATLEAMAKEPLALDFAALRRVLTERAAHAGAIIEDGSGTDADGNPATYLDSDGQRRPVPDLVGDATTRLLQALDLETPEDARRFFQERAAEDFQSLRVPVRFPDRPEYYTSNKPMELAAEIDRGDIWYDFPIDAKGNRLPQPRERFPVFTLFVKWRGERVPLCRWRTTIGGWRAEQGDHRQE